jgi:hypothetical protein
MVMRQRFRWSEPEASLALQIPRRDCRVILELPAFCPPRAVLQRDPVFTISGRRVPAENTFSTGGSLILEIPSPLLENKDAQELAWSIEPLHPEGDDPRTLGLPVFRMWICPR